MRSWFRPVALPGMCVAVAAVMLLGARAEATQVLLDPVIIVGATPPSRAGLDMTSFFPNPSRAVQAVGSSHQPEDTRRTDHTASLRNATELMLDAPGVQVLNPKVGRHYGTYELVELVQQVGANFALIHPDQAIQVGDLSLRNGGTIREADGRRVHSSHRNGLDVDVRYLYEDCNLQGRFDDGLCKIAVQQNLALMRMFVEGGPASGTSMVDVIYVGEPFQQQLCAHLANDDVDAERYREVVDRIQVMGGHTAHFHVRIHCPENSLRCPKPRQHRPDICPRLYAEAAIRRF